MICSRNELDFRQTIANNLAVLSLKTGWLLECSQAQESACVWGGRSTAGQKTFPVGTATLAKKVF